jgi:DNA-binding transcriptional ArsR family regulator
MVEHRAVALDAAYGALANPARRAIVIRLLGGEKRVTDLARPFDMSLAAVSKHIRVLEDAGLVRRRIDGRTHWLALETAPLRSARDWLDAAQSFWEDRLDALDALLRAQPGEH